MKLCEHLVGKAVMFTLGEEERTERGRADRKKGREQKGNQFYFWNSAARLSLVLICQRRREGERPYGKPREKKDNCKEEEGKDLIKSAWKGRDRTENGHAYSEKKKKGGGRATTPIIWHGDGVAYLGLKGGGGNRSYTEKIVQKTSSVLRRRRG